MKAETVMERISVLDTPVDAVDMDIALQTVEQRISMGTSTPAYIVAVNPEKVFALRSNPDLRTWFDGAALIVPDGVGIVLAARILSGKRIGRVQGANLMERICARAAKTGHRIFLFGSSESVNRAAAEELARRYPGLNIAGRANGYVPVEDTPRLIAEINASHADILFVALGSPRQETWIRANLSKLDVKVCQGVGGTLDTIAGTVRRAPAWVQAAGFEWLHRLLRQPSRIGRQLNLLRFVAEVLLLKFSAGRAVSVRPAA
jgi:N-acetylglucosaminyldiphosphoundecaprenol N-acetyl-beta-D-mannosaminyltransferase